MPFTDPAFINVLDDASPEASQVPVAFRQVAGLEARLRILDAQLPIERRWTLYITEDGTISEDLALRSHLTLVLAPRVKLTLAPGKVLTIRGPTDLGRSTRFHLGEGARVRLLGELDEILPVWWHIERFDARFAIDAAIQAVLERAELGLPQAPVVLDRSYRLYSVIEIEWISTDVEDGQREIIIRGRNGLGELGAGLAHAF